MFENIVHYYYTEDGVKNHILINMNLLTKINVRHGARINKNFRKSHVMYKLYKKKHPFLSKLYNPYESIDFSSWVPSKVFILYTRQDSVSITFKSNRRAEQFYDHLNVFLFKKKENQLLLE